jgi:ADP-ribose pyrophosphatase YjhB (NUDIX family)
LGVFLKRKEIVPAVLAIIKDGDKFLVTKRHGKSRFEAGKWGFVGEAMKFGEQPEDTLKRGIKEETSLDLKNYDYVDVKSFVLDSADKTRHVVLLIYICETEGEVKLNHEAEEFGWFTLNEVKNKDKIKGNEKIIEMLESKF